MSGRRQPRKTTIGEGLYSMLQSVLLASIERGQFAVAVLGYVLALALLAAWVLHARHLTRMFERELARVTAERNDAQARCLAGHIRSSEAL